MCTTENFVVAGMTCGHCVMSVTEELTAVQGVTDVQVDLASGQVRVTSEQPGRPSRSVRPSKRPATPWPTEPHAPAGNSSPRQAPPERASNPAPVTDLMTASIATMQRQGDGLAGSARPHSPVVPHYEVERRPSPARAALAAVLLRASRAVAPV